MLDSSSSMSPASSKVVVQMRAVPVVDVSELIQNQLQTAPAGHSCWCSGVGRRGAHSICRAPSTNGGHLLFEVLVLFLKLVQRLQQFVFSVQSHLLLHLLSAHKLVHFRQ